MKAKNLNVGIFFNVYKCEGLELSKINYSYNITINYKTTKKKEKLR